MLEILNEFNNSNSRNYKREVLEKYKDNKDFIKIYQLTYDKIKYTFGISMKNITIKSTINDKPLDDILDKLSLLYTRIITGNSAIDLLESLFQNLNKENQEVLKRIIDRDLRIGVGPKEFNKIVSKEHRLFELPYMRCSLINKLKNITYPAILQEKMDGTFRTIIKRGSEIECYSRSGESYNYSKFLNSFKNLPDGAYIGELIVTGIKDRYESNGLINSKNTPEDLDFYMWDFVSIDDFLKGKSKIPYYKRFNVIETLDKPENLKIVKYAKVNNFNEAFILTQNWISEGSEGSILKDLNAYFENRTSIYQIKIKPEFDIDVRIVGFTEGTGKRADKFGAILFESEDQKLKGQCSGFSDDLLDLINSNRDKYINTIMSITGTALSKAKNSESYAILHPRFKELRPDKNTADNLERIREISESIKLF